MIKIVGAIFSVVTLMGCTDPQLYQQLDAERVFHAQPRYRAEVYQNDEFLADCQYYEMSECYKE